MVSIPRLFNVPCVRVYKVWCQCSFLRVLSKTSLLVWRYLFKLQIQGNVSYEMWLTLEEYAINEFWNLKMIANILRDKLCQSQAIRKLYNKF